MVSLRLQEVTQPTTWRALLVLKMSSQAWHSDPHCFADRVDRHQFDAVAAVGIDVGNGTHGAHPAGIETS